MDEGSGSPPAPYPPLPASGNDTDDPTVAFDSANLRDLLLYQRTVRSGPLPDPATLLSLVSVYPDAAQVIFDDFQKQSAHRRELERLAITTGNTLALRGQAIGGSLGAIGLVGRFIVAALGHEWAASVIGMASLVSLVSVFAVGRDKQRQERTAKAEIREKIRRQDPVEDVDQPGPKPQPTKPATRAKKKPG